VAAVDPFHHEEAYNSLNDRILHEADKLATACNAEVDVIYAHDLSDLGAQERVWQRRPASRPKRPNACSMNRARPSMTCKQRVSRQQQRHMILGNPAKVLSSYADAYNVDVIRHGARRSSRPVALLGSTAESLLYKMPCSVWMVKPEIVD
jgi:universal stress protein E